MIARLDGFIARDALPLFMIAIALIFARALPWILGVMAHG